MSVPEDYKYFLGGRSMGMTDIQFEDRLRSEARDLERIKEEMSASKGEKSPTLDNRLQDIEALLKRL